jgi:arginase
MGRGALRLAADPALRAAIEGVGWSVDPQQIEPVDESQAEIARVMELIRRLQKRVQSAVAGASFPLVLAGNCNSCLGTIAGMGGEGLGVVWFDAHADCDDPEENISGFFDVMGLAMLTGRGWRALRGTIPGHRPIAERDVILAGARDLEPYQRRRLASSDIRSIPGAIDEARFEQGVEELAARVSRVYLHVDLDVLDLTEGRANAYAAPGGPTLERLLRCIREACQRFTVSAAAITAYDPGTGDSDRVVVAARRIAGEIAAGALKDRPG